MTVSLARNFLLLTIGELVSKACAFIAFAYLARVLGPREFGQLEFALALVVFFTLLVDCGLGSYGAREIARDNSLIGCLTTHVLFLRCLLGVCAFALLIVLLSLLGKPWPVQKLIVLYGLTLLLQPGLLPWVFQGRDLMRYVALASMMRWAFFASGVLLFVNNPEATWMVPLIESGGILCVVTFYFLIFPKHFGALDKRINYRYAVSVFYQALPIGASELVWALKIYFATVLLGVFLSGPEVGWFAAAHRLVVSLHAFVWLYFFNLLPSISRGSGEDFSALQNLMRGSLEVTGWAGVFVAMIGTVLAKPLLTLVYGSEYESAVSAFRVLIWLIPLALVSGHFRYTLIAHNKQGLEFLTAVCGGVLNVVVNLTVTRAYGIIGAAISLIAAEALVGALAYLFVRRTIASIPVGVYLWKPATGVAIMAGILCLMPLSNIWLVAGFTIAAFFGLVSLSHRTLIADVRSLLAGTRS